MVAAEHSCCVIISVVFATHKHRIDIINVGLHPYESGDTAHIVLAGAVMMIVVVVVVFVDAYDCAIVDYADYACHARCVLVA